MPRRRPRLLGLLAAAAVAAAVAVAPASGLVVLSDGEGSEASATLPHKRALFGPADGSFTGELVAASPLDGCLSPPETLEGRVLLVERGGGCDFVSKVALADAAGAVAVVVFGADGPDAEGLYRMAAASGAPSVGVPSAYVRRSDGVFLLEELEVRAAVNGTAAGEAVPLLVTLDARGEVVSPPTDEELRDEMRAAEPVTALFAAMLVVLCCGVLGMAAVRQRRERQRAELRNRRFETIAAVRFGGAPGPSPEDAAAAEAAREELQQAVLAQRCPQTGYALGGARNDTCSVCLDEFTSEDSVKVLPCRHAFHPACIDPWIINHSECCPTCRHSILEEHSLEQQGGEQQPLVAAAAPRSDTEPRQLEEGLRPLPAAAREL